MKVMVWYFVSDINNVMTIYNSFLLFLFCFGPWTDVRLALLFIPLVCFFCFLFCFLSPLVWFFLWLPEEVLALLFLLHRENGDERYLLFLFWCGWNWHNYLKVLLCSFVCNFIDLSDWSWCWQMLLSLWYSSLESAESLKPKCLRERLYCEYVQSAVANRNSL